MKFCGSSPSAAASCMSGSAGRYSGSFSSRLPGGGYAAVRPEKGKTGADSPGAITNYLEGGHRIASPRGGKNYRPRLRVSYVSGYHFYAAAAMRAESIAIGEAEAWADELARELEASL